MNKIVPNLKAERLFFCLILAALFVFQGGLGSRLAAEGAPPMPHPMPEFVPKAAPKEAPKAPPRTRGLSHPLPKHGAPPTHTPSGQGNNGFMQKLQSYKGRLKKNPADIEALVFLANANFDIQRFETAEKLYLRALEVDPENLHIRTDLASAYRNLGNSAKAVESLQKILEMNANHEVALYNLGSILLNDRGDEAGAADAWERLVKINPKDPLAKELQKKIKVIREGQLKPN